MCGTERDRKPSSTVAVRLTAALALIAGLCAPARAADGFWDGMLETLNVKAAPAEPAPAFVERTRPDPAGLGYLPAAVPHKVSPLPVKTAAQIEAETKALDAAKVRQLDPGAPTPLQVGKSPGGAGPQRAAKARKPAPAPAAPAVVD